MIEQEESPSVAMLECLLGLAVGDAFGEVHAYGCYNIRSRLTKPLAPGPWWYTDDTAMAIGIVEHLKASGLIYRKRLVNRFAVNYHREPDRGYGKMARIILERVYDGADWEAESYGAFNGGSMGNGAAMRVAPLGVYFSGDDELVVDQARRSAVVTHAHPDGIAGAIAIALAASEAFAGRGSAYAVTVQAIWERVLDLVPDSDTRKGLEIARNLPADTKVKSAARTLGSGFQVTAPDTVPFVIWSALRHLTDYEEGLIATVEADGDCDTNAAMVGGIITAYLGVDAIPKPWLERCEKLPLQHSFS